MSLERTDVRDGLNDTLALVEKDRLGATEVAIADTGPGIAPQVLEHLFEFQFNEKRGENGPRLGLPTARRIVERHGGTLDVRTRLGEGTEFTLGLPVDPSEGLSTPTARIRFRSIDAGSDDLVL